MFHLKCPCNRCQFGLIMWLWQPVSTGLPSTLLSQCYMHTSCILSLMLKNRWKMLPDCLVWKFEKYCCQTLCSHSIELYSWSKSSILLWKWTQEWASWSSRRWKKLNYKIKVGDICDAADGLQPENSKIKALRDVECFFRFVKLLREIYP